MYKRGDADTHPALDGTGGRLLEDVALGIALSHARWTGGDNADADAVRANLTPLRRYEAHYALLALQGLLPAALWRDMLRNIAD